MRAAFMTLALAAAGIAWAGDNPAEAPAEEAEAPAEEAAEEAAPDCSKLEGDEKTKCEEAAKAAEAEEAAEEEAPKKGGKAKRDSSGNMEAEMDDE